MAMPEDQNNTQQDPQTTAQLEKLRLEIADLKWKVRWVYKFADLNLFFGLSVVPRCNFVLSSSGAESKQRSRKLDLDSGERQNWTRH